MRSRLGSLILLLVVAVAASCVPPPPAPENVPRSRIVYVPASIDATGRTDVTWPLRQLFSTTPNNRTIVFPPGARYRVEGTLRLHERKNLTFFGNGATIFATTRGDHDRMHWRFIRGSDITVRDLVVRGAHPNGGTDEDAYVPELEGQHGFRFEGTQGVELDRVTVTDVYGDFVYFGRDQETRTWTQDAWVHHSKFHRNGRQGIAVTAGRDITIEGNVFREVRRSTIDLEANVRSGGAIGIRVVDNFIGRGRLNFLSSYGAGPVNDIVISGNRLNEHALNITVKAPEGERRSNWTVTDNVSDYVAHRRSMRFIRVDHVTIRGNTQTITKPSVPGVILWDVCGFDVSGNDFGVAVPYLLHEPC